MAAVDLMIQVRQNMSDRDADEATKTNMSLIELGIPIADRPYPVDAALTPNAYDSYRTLKDELGDSIVSVAFDDKNFSSTLSSEELSIGSPILMPSKICLYNGLSVVLTRDLPGELFIGSKLKVLYTHKDFVLCASTCTMTTGIWYRIPRVTSGCRGSYPFQRTQFPLRIDVMPNMIKLFGPVCLSARQFVTYCDYEHERSEAQGFGYGEYLEEDVNSVIGTKEYFAEIYLQRFAYIPNAGKYYVFTLKKDSII